MTTTNVLLFKFRCNIFIGVRIITEMPGFGASRTPCIIEGDKEGKYWEDISCVISFSTKKALVKKKISVTYDDDF